MKSYICFVKRKNVLKLSLTLLHSEWPKLNRVLVILSAKKLKPGLNKNLNIKNWVNFRSCVNFREQNTDDWHIDIEDAILEKCKNNNGILHIFVDRSSKEVRYLYLYMHFLRLSDNE